MNGMTPQLLSLFVVSMGVGYLMTLGGLHKQLLERRRQERSCPSCGRAIEQRVCANCAS